MNPKICRRSQFYESAFQAVSKMKLEQLLTLTLSNTVAFTANNVNCSETVQSGTAHQCMYSAVLIVQHSAEFRFSTAQCAE